MEPLRVGLVGLGGMGRNHLAKEVTSPLLKFVGVADVVKTAVDEVSASNNIPGFYDPQELIDRSGCEAVIIATPHPFHAPLALAAIRRGLHVMSEKPIAVSVSEADGMVSAAREAGVKLGVMFRTRTVPAYRRARELLQAGEIGTLYRSVIVASQWYRSQAYYDSGSWRGTWKGEGGGIVMNQAPHSLDMFIWLGGKPSRVTARVQTRAHRIEVEDTVEALLDYEAGHTGYLYATTAEWPGEDRYEFTGDRGKLVIQGGDLRLYKMTASLADNLETNAMWGKPQGAWEEIEVPDEPSGHLQVLEQFARAIREGAPPVAVGEDGVNSLELANSLLLSGYQNRPVDLPLDRAAYDRFIAEKRGS